MCDEAFWRKQISSVKEQLGWFKDDPAEKSAPLYGQLMADLEKYELGLKLCIEDTAAIATA